MSDWKEVNSTTDETWNKDDGKPIEGVYREMKTNIGQNNSNMYVIEVEGKNVGVWGSTVIDTKMGSVPIGAEVHIEYIGKVTSKNGKSYDDFKVMYRPTPMQEVFPESVGQ